jgi:hypothetical protein
LIWTCEWLNDLEERVFQISKSLGREALRWTRGAWSTCSSRVGPHGSGSYITLFLSESKAEENMGQNRICNTKLQCLYNGV